MTTLAIILSAAQQWAEDDDPALAAARAAWDRLDQLLVAGLLLLAGAVALVSTVLLLRQPKTTRRRRLSAVAVLLAGCGAFGLAVARMGVVWLVADPAEAGGPALGSGAYWGWLSWLGGATLAGIVGVVAAFIIVGAEEL